ncbi:MAG: hypothetical protein IJO77_02900, partial [Oscillospiraceae bacterium]|nr:hypothetical protein [Oscillospiraceae bacterium]
MQRIFRKKDVIKRLGEIALGRSNDPVKLAFTNPDRLDIDSLDLTMLSELRRAANGSVEIKLFNRLDALKIMMEALRDEPGNEALEFLQTLCSAEAGDA